ncbi:MAG: restriction endonuclease subunit S [Allomuricauda sp.]
MKEDWVEMTVGEVADYLNGRGFKKSEWETRGLPIIRIQNLNDSEAPFNYTQGTFQQRYSVKDGDLLFSWAASLGVYIWNRGDAWLNQHIFKVVPKSFLLKHYMRYFLENTIQNFYAQTHGSGMVHITKRKFEATSIKLPSLNEQQAIVNKIEELFSSLDSGIADLKKAKDQLKIYRQAVLKKAFEGELTKEWREKQTNLPTEDELLEQIENGRQSFFNKQIEEWELELKIWKEQGEVDKKPKKPRPLTVPDEPNNGHIERKWDIPKKWIWSQIGTLCFVTKLAGFEYTDYVNYDENGDLPVLKAENAGPNGFKKTDFSKVKSESVKMLKRSQIFGGELLVVFVGAGTGNVAMVPNNQRYFLGPNIGMARPYFGLNSKYLELFLQSAFGKSLMMSAVKAVAQPSLSMSTIRQAPIAFPSIKEQHQIVQEIESRLSVCDAVEQNILESLEKAQALRQSILKKAFEGKLLSEKEITKCKAHPDYEPASVLLDKIKSSRKEKVKS